MPGSLGLDHGLNGRIGNQWTVGYAAQLSYDIETMVKMLQWVVTYFTVHYLVGLISPCIIAGTSTIGLCISEIDTALVSHAIAPIAQIRRDIGENNDRQ